MWERQEEGEMNINNDRFFVPFFSHQDAGAEVLYGTKEQVH